MDDIERPVVPYQPMLRVIGAMLDELEASDMAVLEGHDSFTVRLSAGTASETRALTFTDLLEASQALSVDRTRRDLPAQGRYQDLLRALGYEMEQARARNLIFAGASGHFFLVYEGAGRERYKVLTPGLIQETVSRARARRGTGGITSYPGRPSG